ncbi:MAG: ComGF family competence protein [Bacillaceae bacterium]|nr:ComGF family competence protein [Bacillaceae bacterium]
MKNEKGTTLLEVVIAFAIFLIIISLFPLFYQMLQPIDPKVRQRIETTLFFQQLGAELQNGHDIQAYTHSLHMTNKDNQLVSYDLVNEKVRRQVNRRGQEMVLLNTSEIRFSKTERSVTVIVIDVFKQEHRHRIPLLVKR